MLPDSEARYSTTKFIASISGLLKIIAILMFLASSIVFLSLPLCDGMSSWLGRLYPITAVISGVLIASFYISFAIGLVKRGYNTWMMIDLVLNMIDFTVMLVVSVMTTSQCSSASFLWQMVPGPMGIAGAIFLAVSCIIWFIQNRANDDLPLAQPATSQTPHLWRKSVMV